MKKLETANILNFRVLGKKFFSLSLVFNALLTIACATGILGCFYWFFQDWNLFSPYLINGNVFWVVIVAAVINIFPSACLGRALKTGRFLFHHYFYGFLVLFFSGIYVVVFTPVSLLSIFLVNNTSIGVNVGRFFLLGGWTLVLDDLPDVHEKVDSALNWLKAKVGQGGRLVSAVQLIAGAGSFYVFAAVTLAVYNNPEWVTVANLILIGTLFITGVTSFIFVRRQVWQKIAVKR
jgi:hypothetical protein